MNNMAKWRHCHHAKKKKTRELRLKSQKTEGQKKQEKGSITMYPVVYKRALADENVL
jgi:hypothetical protein